VTFDFTVKLPKTSRENDSVCIFVDKLTKLVHSVACKKKVSAKEFVELCVDHVVRLHGLSREFITDRDSHFTSAFWQEVIVLLGTRTVCRFLSIRKCDDLGLKWSSLGGTISLITMYNTVKTAGGLACNPFGCGRTVAVFPTVTTN
jgi:hypothetical protein